MFHGDLLQSVSLLMVGMNTLAGLLIIFIAWKCIITLLLQLCKNTLISHCFVLTASHALFCSLSLLFDLVARMSFASQDTDFSVSEVESVPLYVTLAFSFLGFIATFVFYIITAKCVCCKQCSCPEESLLKNCCGASCCTEAEEQQPSSYCSTYVLTVLQLCAKVILVLANIVYIVVTVIEVTSDTQHRNGSNQSNMTADNSHVGMAGQYVSAISAAWEIVTIILVLPFNVFCWLKRKKEKCSCLECLAYLRFGDLQITSLLVPLGNVSLFHGDARFVVSLIRMTFYAITFITDVVNGVKCDCCCCVSSDCGHDNNPGEIKNKGYAATKMVMKGIEILLKMITSSSAIATFLFTGLHIPIVSGVFYLIFTLLCGITATGSLWLSAIVTRWEVVKDNTSTSCCAGVIDCLKKRQPHVHAIFVLDIITFGGLIGVNIYIAANVPPPSL